MDHKKNIHRRNKRKVMDDNFWDCSVCTYRNTAEAFKCLMCDVRKGTSTRKPRINPQLVAQQVAQQFGPAPPKPKKELSLLPSPPLPLPIPLTVPVGGKDKERIIEKKSLGTEKHGKKSKHPPRLKNVDRSTAQHREVTVNDVTVIITEYKPKPKKSASASSGISSDQSGQSSSVSSENGNQSESSSTERNGDLGNDSRSS